MTGDVFTCAQALPAAFPQLHNMLADHTRTFGTVLRNEEALISDILSEVRPQDGISPSGCDNLCPRWKFKYIDFACTADDLLPEWQRFLISSCRYCS